MRKRIKNLSLAFFLSAGFLLTSGCAGCRVEDVEVCGWKQSEWNEKNETERRLALEERARKNEGEPGPVGGGMTLSWD